jgi:hypothetical protein
VVFCSSPVGIYSSLAFEFYRDRGVRLAPHDSVALQLFARLSGLGPHLTLTSVSSQVHCICQPDQVLACCVLCVPRFAYRFMSWT